MGQGWVGSCTSREGDGRGPRRFQLANELVCNCVGEPYPVPLILCLSFPISMDRWWLT